MTKDETYYFHQTPEALARDLIQLTPLEEGDTVIEPFKGEGAFYDNLPNNVEKDFSELEEGRDYANYQYKFNDIDWVISNPPFRLENDKGKRVNSFYFLLEYYSKIVKKGIAFLANDRCFSTLTPKRLKSLNESEIYISTIIVCNVKKWRGRYFYIIFEKKPSQHFKYLIDSY